MIAPAERKGARRALGANESSTTRVPSQVTPPAPVAPVGVDTSASTAFATPVRQCPRCRVWVPAGCFRLHSRKDGSEHRLAHCDECRWQAERERRERALRTKRQRAMFKGWADIARAHKKRWAIATLVGRLWDELGGSDGIAHEWALALKEGSAAQRVRACESLVRLTEWLEQNPEVLADPSAMSGKQLEEEAQQARIKATLELFRTDPEAAKMIASKFESDTVTT